MLLGLTLWLWVQFILFPKHKTSALDAVTTPPTQLADSVQRPKLSTYHLFGSSSVSEVPLDLLQAETSLDLIITGIIASTDPEQGLAYIRNRQGDEKKFKVGDDVFGLAKVAEIHAGYLLLSRGGGKQEKLSLSKGYALNTTTAQPRRGDGATTASEKAAAKQRITNHINKSAAWQDAVNQQKFDPNKIAKIVNNISVVKDGQGKVAGLRVSQLSSGSELVKQGLRANDQIVSVNGVDISYQNILTLQSQLQNSSSVNVTVMRNGRKMNLNLNLSELQQ